ncbi:MAG: hypothetical protein H3C47_11635 [Candidatus Cloacimonetes bacterium]|nr:hypothetical protein [Candidatus Cloacimonadota bacterium]
MSIETISQQDLVALFEECLEPHLEFLPSILGGTRKDLVQAAIALASVLHQDRFDSQIIRLIVHNEYFHDCLQVLSARPKAAYLSVVLKSWDKFPIKNQSKLIPLLWKYGNKEEVTAFFMSRFANLDSTIRVTAMEALVRLGINEGRYFVFQRLMELTLPEQLDLLNVLFECDFELDFQTTKDVIQRFQDNSAVDIRAAYLRLLAKGDPELSLAQLTECLQRQPEMIISAAFDALIQLKLHEQIPEAFLQQYSSSKFYRLAMNVARIYGFRWQHSHDRDALAQGLRILSWLLNDDALDAKLAAIEGAHCFHEDPRVLEWIGSLLLSESDEELLKSAVEILKKHPASPAKKALLMKACERSIPALQQLALELLERHAESSMVPILLELIHKEKIRNPNVAFQAVSTLSYCILAKEEDEQKYFSLLSEDSSDMRRAVILGMQNWRSESSRRLLEREYQNCTGLNKSLAAFILFQKGVTYILDDLYDQLASDSSQDQKCSLLALSMIQRYLQDCPLVQISKDVLTNIELWHTQVASKKLEESVLKDFNIRILLPLRQLILSEKYQDAMQWIEKKAEDDAGWFLTLTRYWLMEKLEMPLEAEALLQITERAPDCILGHELLLSMYRNLRRKSEFVHHQLQLLEMKHRAYGQLLTCLNELPKETYETPMFLNIIKMIQTGGMPSDASMHQVLSSIYIKIKRYDFALEHLCYGYFANPSENWFLELASCFAKTGSRKEAKQVCKVAPKLGVSPAVRDKLEALESKISQDVGQE